MTRGLSQLQRRILELLPEPRDEGDSMGGRGYVRLQELLAEIHDLPYSGHHLDVDAIGRKRYNALRSSFHRAVVRLEQRGLVERKMGMPDQVAPMYVRKTVDASDILTAASTDPAPVNTSADSAATSTDG